MLDVQYGPHGYLQSFHMTFMHRCQGDAAALRGDVKLVAAPPPPLLELDLTFDPSRTSYDSYDRTIKLFGTVTCSEAAYASVTGDVSERKDSDAAVGSGSIGVNCSRRPTSWLVRAISSNGIPFSADALRVTVQGQAEDAWYTNYTGDRIVASEIISDVEANLPSSALPGVSFISRHPAWSLVIALSIIAAAPWSILALRSIRGRAGR